MDYPATAWRSFHQARSDDPAASPNRPVIASTTTSRSSTVLDHRYFTCCYTLSLAMKAG